MLAHSGVAFGTSGARGLVTQFIPNVCVAFTVTFIQCMQRNFKFETVAIAIDNRPSSYAMAKASSAAYNNLAYRQFNTVLYRDLP